MLTELINIFVKRRVILFKKCYKYVNIINHVKPKSEVRASHTDIFSAIHLAIKVHDTGHF